MTSTKPCTKSVEAFLDEVDRTLSDATVNSPFTLIIGAGFSAGVIPGSRDIIDRVPKWLDKNPSSFWLDLNTKLLPEQQVTLTESNLPDLSTRDFLNSAYGAAMLYGLNTPARRTQILPRVMR